MTDLLTSGQMRAIEGAAIAAGGPGAGRMLMERAGAAIAAAILARWPTAQATVVLAGPGNNGGDGYVVARRLHAAGWRVTVIAPLPPATPDAQAAADDCPVPAEPSLTWTMLAGRPVVVDAQFGTGLGRPIAPGVWGNLAMAQEARCPLVAVDILSGICADSGRILSPDYIEQPADLTVTFQCPRPGHVLGEGGRLAGELLVADLGLQRELEALLRTDGAAVAELTGPPDVAKTGGHKYDHGHALVLAGPATRGGAARLAARAALRIGAGLVTLGAPRDALAENAARLDAVMLREVGTARALAQALQDERINAVLLGPGLGADRAPGLVRAAAAAPGLVLDADALSAQVAGGLPAPRGDLHPGKEQRVVLTPHDGEFARIAPDLAARLGGVPDAGPAFSRIDAARAAAARFGAVLLLKGPGTVIAAPDGRAAVNAATGPRAVPWLATAGAGDVLAGLITGLLARGLPPFEAACAAAWLHVEAARLFGPGLIAEDLPDAIPAVLRARG